LGNSRWELRDHSLFILFLLKSENRNRIKRKHKILSALLKQIKILSALLKQIPKPHFFFFFVVYIFFIVTDKRVSISNSEKTNEEQNRSNTWTIIHISWCCCLAASFGSYCLRPLFTREAILWMVFDRQTWLLLLQAFLVYLRSRKRRQITSTG
jgi:hypothetical protein